MPWAYSEAELNLRVIMRVLLMFLIVCMLGLTMAFPHINQQNPRNRPDRPSRFEGPQSREYFQVSRKIQTLEARLAMKQGNEQPEGLGSLQSEIDALKVHKTLIESRLEESGISVPRGDTPDHPAKRDLKAQMSRRIAELDESLNNNPNMPEDQRSMLMKERDNIHQRLQHLFGESYDPQARANGHPHPGPMNKRGPLNNRRP